ncbi:MAG: isoprenyl transferase [Clostridiales Family XIII bacterium]|nr:isoprenyl transferase [Clostridiales Family XIII bacterium]
MSILPRHIAIVMDGNGRWAEKHGKRRLQGHDAGMKAMKEIVKRSSALGVGYLTVYAFSTENWKRSAIEVSGIFKLLVRYVDQELQELNDNNVVVNILGSYRSLPADAVAALERALATTARNTGLHFNIALNYGSRPEICEAVRSVAVAVKDGRLSPEEITEEIFSGFLDTGGMPDPDLVIRTSGEKRLSNFLLWQSAYSEFVFTDVLWPDFSPEELERCIEEFRQRNRRFGGR